MDKKKAVAVGLVAVAIAVGGYAVLPRFLGGDEAPTIKNDVAKMRAEPPKKLANGQVDVSSFPDAKPNKSETKKEEIAAAGVMLEMPRIAENIAEAPESAKAVLPAVSPAQASDERRLQATLRDIDMKKVDHEYRRALSKIEREGIEDEVAMERARTDADRAKAERAYLRANPSQLLSKTTGGVGGPGMPPSPIPSGPGSTSGPVPVDGFDQPALRMISMVGNEKTAHIEYRGSLYRVKSGDTLADWKVKTVADESVQLTSGKTARTLKFGLPMGDSVNATLPLPPPPAAVRRPGST